MTDIFISYASQDRSRVEPIAKALEDQGWKVFWDRTIPAGKTWRQVIGEALETARSVIVAWSNSSVESTWVQEEADSGRERNILIPILIDDVKPPLGFGAIQAADLIRWEPTQSSPEFEKLISDLSAILGPSPLKVRESEQKRAEAEPRLQQDEERERRIEEQRKAEKELERKDAEAKRKAEGDQKRKVLEAEIEPDEPEPVKSEPTETKTVEKAPIESRPSPPIPPKVRKSSTALIFGAVAGVIVLLMIVGLLYYQYQQKIEGFQDQVESLERELVEHAVAKANQNQLKELSEQRKDLSDQVEGISKLVAIVGLKSQLTTLQNHLKQVQIQEETLFKIYKLDGQVEALKGSVANVENQEQLKNFSKQRKDISDQIERINEEAAEVDLISQFNELQNHLKQVQIQEETLFKIYEFEEQIRELENAVATVDKLEQIEKLYSQRNTLNKQVEALNEQATKVGLGLQFEQFQARLKNFNTQLAKKEEELITARKGKLFVATDPDNATVKILNIDEPFQQGMQLEPGRYHVQVSSEGYEPQDRWTNIGPGEEKKIDFELEKKLPPNIATRPVSEKEGWVYLGTYENGTWIKQHFDFPKDATPESLNQTSQVVNNKTFSINVREEMISTLGQKSDVVHVLKAGDKVKIMEVKEWKGLFRSGYMYARIKYED